MNEYVQFSIAFIVIIFLIVFLHLKPSFRYSIDNIADYGFFRFFKNKFTTKNCFNEYFDMIACICIPERKKHMINVFNKLGIKNVIFHDATLKNNHTPEEFIQNNFLDVNYDSQVLNMGRICCHYSAMTIYKKFLESDAKNIIIFEDDIRIDTYTSKQDFNYILQPVLEYIPTDWEYLNFSKCHDYCFQNIILPNNPFWSIPKRPLCRTAIALTKKAAKLILQECSPMIDKPGDRMIAELITNNMLKAYSTKQIFFYQHREMFGSNLQNRHPTNPPMCQGFK
tara:strand:- start:1068 stop:1913 length:846 start_codon:yes stop_codon:yes gene_type:complete